METYPKLALTQETKREIADKLQRIVATNIFIIDYFDRTLFCKFIPEAWHDGLKWKNAVVTVAETCTIELYHPDARLVGLQASSVFTEGDLFSFTSASAHILQSQPDERGLYRCYRLQRLPAVQEIRSAYEKDQERRLAIRLRYQRQECQRFQNRG